MNGLTRNLINYLFLIVFIVIGAFGCGGGDGNPVANGGNGTTTPNPPLPNTELELYQRGTAEFDAANYTVAVQAFDKLLKNFPDGRFAAAAHHSKGRAHYELKEYPAAIDEFSAVLAQFAASSDAPSAQYWLGRSHHAAGSYADARTAYTKIVDEPPFNASAFVDDAAFQLAKIDYDQGFFDTAVNSLTGFITAHNASIWVDGANYYIGRSHMDKTIPDFNAARSSFTLVTDKSVYFDNAQFQFAKSYFDEKIYGMAIIQLNAFILNHSASTLVDDANYYLGRSHHDDISIPDNFSKARDFYTLVWNNKQSILADDARYQMGKTHYDEANAQSDPASAYGMYGTGAGIFGEFTTDPDLQASDRKDTAFYFRGRCLHEQGVLLQGDNQLDMNATYMGRYQSARDDYAQVIALKTTWADNAQYQIGKTHFDEGTFDSAIVVFSELLPLGNPQNFPDHSADDDALYYRGRSYESRAAINSSSTDYGAAIVDFSDLSTSAAYDASSWKDNATYELGLSYFSRAKLSTPTADIADLNSALGSFATVLKLKSVSVRADNAAFKIGMAYHSAGMCDDETAAFSYLINNIAMANSVLVSSAESEIQDLATTHICNASLAGVSAFATLSVPADITLPSP